MAEEVSVEGSLAGRGIGCGSSLIVWQAEDAADVAGGMQDGHDDDATETLDAVDDDVGTVVERARWRRGGDRVRGSGPGTGSGDKGARSCGGRRVCRGRSSRRWLRSPPPRAAGSDLMRHTWR